MAQLELGTAAVALSSGAAAVRQCVRNVTDVGSNIVTAPQLYGATYTYFAHVLAGEGVEVRFAADDRAGSIEPLIDDNTRAVFCESIGNPACNVVDIEAVAEAGSPPRRALDRRQHRSHTADPEADRPRCRHSGPFADQVRRRSWHDARWRGDRRWDLPVGRARRPVPDVQPARSRPFMAWCTPATFPTTAYAVRCRTVGLRNEGATLAPLNAFLLLQGLETLSVRLERHQQNALQVAEYLAQDRRVAWVGYLGFTDHPHHDLAKRYLGGRYPSIVTFGASGGLRREHPVLRQREIDQAPRQHG